MDDRNIVDLYWQRSERAISETAKKYGGYCHQIAYNILANSEDTEECVNDTYMSAWNSMPDKRPGILAPFLGKICRNNALNRIERGNRKKRGGGETNLVLDELSECIASKQSVEKEVELKELSAAVNRFLVLLSQTERQVFLSRCWFMYPVSEIAEKFGFSVSKTNSMLHRIRIKLRNYLQEEGLC